MVKTKIICLCGSTRFTDEMLVKQWELTKQGHVVLTWCVLPNSYFTQGSNLAEKENVKDIVDETHKRKIDLSDEILVININDYVGDSTKSEIAYAIQHNKPVKWLKPHKG